MAPCTVEWWVIEQSSPMIVGVRTPTWIITKSWMLVRSPMRISSVSLRITTCGHTDDSAPIVTLP